MGLRAMQQANDVAVEAEIRAMDPAEAVEVAVKMQHAYDELMRACEDACDEGDSDPELAIADLRSRINYFA